METITRRTIVIVEEKVGGKLVNRIVNEVSSAGTDITDLLTVIFLCYF